MAIKDWPDDRLEKRIALYDRLINTEQYRPRRQLMIGLRSVLLAECKRRSRQPDSKSAQVAYT